MTQIVPHLTLQQIRDDARERERISVLEALHRHGGNVVRAARDLGMSRGAVYRRMERYGIATPRSKQP